MKKCVQYNLLMKTNGEDFYYMVFDYKGKISYTFLERVDILKGISLFRILKKYNIKDVYLFHDETDEFIPMICFVANYLARKTNVYVLYMEQQEERVFCEVLNLNDDMMFEMNCPGEIYAKALEKTALKIFNSPLLHRDELWFSIAMLISTAIGKFYVPQLENKEVMQYVEKQTNVPSPHRRDNLYETLNQATKDIYFANSVVINAYKDCKISSMHIKG